MSEFNIDKYIASLPDDIEDIRIMNKYLTYVPDLSRFTKLKRLYLNQNKLTTLPATLPDSLEVLSVDHNKLTELPSLPKNLTNLFCTNNYLTELPSLPENLQRIYCSSNRLTYIPNLPSNLVLLYCCFNKLTTLPKLPDKLLELSCSYNKLTKLPDLPNAIELVEIDNNKLHYLPGVPNQCTFLCIDNPVCNIYNLYNYKYEFEYQKNARLIEREIKIIDNFRSLFYSLKFKSQFMEFLWLKVRKPMAEKKYHPDNLRILLDNVHTDNDLNNVLDSW